MSDRDDTVSARRGFVSFWGAGADLTIPQGANPDDGVWASVHI